MDPNDPNRQLYLDTIGDIDDMLNQNPVSASDLTTLLENISEDQRDGLLPTLAGTDFEKAAKEVKLSDND